VFTTPAADLDKQKNILITGHMDTVFPEDTDFNWYREDADKVYGPGVIDMKGGLVVTIFAIKALAAQGLLTDLPIVLLFNSDEEIGSPTSAPLIRELAKNTCCGLVTECGGLQGQVVTSRRGKRGYRLEVQGRAGHAAFAGTNKASAILELAHKAIALEALNNPVSGVVVNVGTVAGGIGPNTIAEHAAALIDSRYNSERDGTSLQKQIRFISESVTISGTTTSLSVTNERPVMESSKQNRQLFHLFQKQAKQLGISLVEEFRWGVSDANTLAGEGVAVLDGLGPVGEFAHSDREYMVKSSLPERSLLLAATLPGIAAACSS
jgi:glutamate carboxypeptidase